MRIYRNILLISMLLPISLSAQVKYDTIPDPDDGATTGRYCFEELFIFKDFGTQAMKYFDEVNWENVDCKGKRVFISTIFGKNGKLKNTCVAKSVNPICDSIAFYFIAGLKDWLPGLIRGRFVDIPFVFPITFDSLKPKGRYSLSIGFLSATEKEYAKRKEYFDFVYSLEYQQRIIKDFDFFKKYMAEVLRDSLYVYLLNDYKFERKESAVLQFNSSDNKNTHILVRDAQKEWLLYECRWKRGKVRIPRNRKLLIIIYKEGATPLLQTEIITLKRDTVINLKLEKYTKGRLLDEIKEY